MKKLADSQLRNFLFFTVFITGSAVLIVEITALRILSPYYGNTIFTASSVITVVLAGLSFGYYFGGRLADNKPSLKLFFSIIFLSGVSLLGIQLAGNAFLPGASNFFSVVSGPLVFALLLFFLPSLLLGLVSPFAVKLQKTLFPKQGVGSIAGNIFFWSTAGSIAGSLATGFILIPNFDIRTIMTSTGIGLSLLGLLPLFFIGEKKPARNLTVLLVCIVAVSFLVKSPESSATVFTKNGVYEKITIFDGFYKERKARFLKQDQSNSSAMFLDSSDPTDLVFNYTKYYALYRIFNPDIKDILAIGSGAYSVPKAFLAELPEARIDVVEIEPSLFSLAKTYFNLNESDRLTNYTQDGRRFLKQSGKKYDFIFSDAYHSLYSIPQHLSTKEFFLEAKESLNDKGIFMANVIGNLSRQQPSLIFSMVKTFKTAFPNSYFFAVESPYTTDAQNIIFVGYNSSDQINFDNLPEFSEDPTLSSLSKKQIDVSRFELSPYAVFSDTFAPVEYATGKVLQSAFQNENLAGEEMLALVAQQLRYGPRYVGSAGHQKVQDFLQNELRGLADEVTMQKWGHIGTDGNIYELKNIVARFNPEQERRILLGTHYDSKKLADKDFENPEQPVPGANDSASGTAVLAELARLLKFTEMQPNIGIDIVFFDGEEGEPTQEGDYANWKPLGSTYFAKHLNTFYKEHTPELAIIVDMVCDKDLAILKEPLSFSSAPEQAEAFWQKAREVDNRVFKDEVGLEVSDDHTQLNRAGIPSILLIDFEYSYFHTNEDTTDKCSAQSLETVAEAIWKYLDSIR